jgi:hypothetical protein
MAKLKEQWRGRTKQLERVIEEGERPDLSEVRRRVRRERAKAEGLKPDNRRGEHGPEQVERARVARVEKERSRVKSIVQGDLIPTIPTEMVGDVQLSDILRSIINKPNFPKIVENSPGLLQLLINKTTGEKGQQSVIVEPLVFRVLKEGETIKVLQERPLGIVPSEQVEELKNGEDFGKVTTPTTPKPPVRENLSIDLGNDFEILGSPNPPTPEP